MEISLKFVPFTVVAGKAEAGVGEGPDPRSLPSLLALPILPEVVRH